MDPFNIDFNIKINPNLKAPKGYHRYIVDKNYLPFDSFSGSHIERIDLSKYQIELLISVEIIDKSQLFPQQVPMKYTFNTKTKILSLFWQGDYSMTQTKVRLKIYSIAHKRDKLLTELGIK